MDDLSFRCPRKVLKWIATGLFGVAILYGLVTRSLDNFWSLWMWAVTFIAEPIFDFNIERMDRLFAVLLEAAFSIRD